MSVVGVGQCYVKAYDNSFQFGIPFTAMYPEFNRKTILRNVSPYNGYKTYVTRWNDQSYKLVVKLFDAQNSTAFYAQLQQIELKQVYFKPHKYDSDGVTLADFVKDATGADVLFQCIGFKLLYLNNSALADAVEIILEATKPTSLNVQGWGVI